MDIVIYMNDKDFIHKTDASMFDCYWEMKRFPKKFTVDDKLFIAMKGHVMGYVEVLEFNPDRDISETILWDGDSFLYIESIPCKQFRGFRYRWFDYELEASKEKQRGNN